MTIPGTMSLAELQKLVAESKGEWEHLEFKKTTGELHGGMETLCGFLNGTDGKVMFGVTNAGRIQGQDMADPTFQEVANAIRKLEPPAWIDQVRVPVAGTKEVLILETTQQTDGPYTFDGRPYQRIGNTTSRMPQAEYQRRLLARASAQHRWENQVAEGYSSNDLDLEEIDRAVRAAIYCGRLESQASDPFDAPRSAAIAGRWSVAQRGRGAVRAKVHAVLPAMHGAAWLDATATTRSLVGRFLSQSTTIVSKSPAWDFCHRELPWRNSSRITPRASATR